MTCPWPRLAHLLVALALWGTAVAGCFDSHGVPPGGADAGAVSDAPGCRALDAVVEALRCELRGGEGVAVVTTSPTLCCSSGTPSTRVAASGTTHDISVAWSACDCCAACRCVGPVEEVEVSLGVLAPGHHVVRAHGSSCTLDVGEPPECVPGGGDEVRMPRALFSDQPLRTTVVARGTGGCGCDPRLTLPDPASSARALSLELCACCWACDCIDGGYEASALGGTWPLGEHRIATPAGERRLLVTTRDAVSPREPVALRIVPPDDGSVVSGPRIHWAVVTTTEFPCCAEPVTLLEEGVGPAGEIALSAWAANLDDCACVGEPTLVEAWLPLVDLPSGEHVVRAGAHEARILVP